MNKFFQHIRVNMGRGLLAVIPLFLSVVAVALLYKLIDKRVMVFLDQYFDVHHIPGFGVLILLFFLLLIGLITSNVVGRRLLRVVEYISVRIPFVKQVYSVSKQIGDVLGSTQGRDVFRKAVLVNYPNANQWTIALLTGRMKDKNTGEDWLKVYIPMAHPVIGFVYMVKEKQVLYPGWSVEEALKMVVSLGIIAPKTV